MIDCITSAIYVFTAHFMSWHAVNLVFEVMDRVPSMRRHKHPHRDTGNYFTMAPVVLFNQLCLLLPFMVWVSHAVSFTDDFRLWSLPISSLGLQLTHDITFYLGHRFLHTEFGYKWFRHDIHHSTYASVGASSMYMSPLDFCVEIIVPFSTWFLIYPGEDWRIASFLVVVGGFSASLEHSGYNFFGKKYQLDTEKHYLHHNGKPNMFFSDGCLSYGIMDKFTGTVMKR